MNKYRVPIYFLILVVVSSNPASAQPLGNGTSTGPIQRIVLDGFDAASFPFMNFVKMAVNDVGNYAYQPILNADAYPTRTPAQSILYEMTLPSAYTGKYIISWSGTARYQLLGTGATVYDGGANVIGIKPANSGHVDNNFTVDGTNPTVTFDLSIPVKNVSDNAGLIRIFATNNLSDGTRVIITGVSGVPGANGTFTISNRTQESFDLVGSKFSGAYVSGGRAFPKVASVILAALNTGTFSNASRLIICREADHASILAGKIFNPDFVASLRALHPKVIRPLDINRAIISNATDWNHRTSLNAISYVQDKWLPDYWGGVTVGTDSYTGRAAPATPATMTDGEIWQGQINSANQTTTPTLNVGGRGAYPILDTFATLQNVTITGTVTVGDVLNFDFTAPYLPGGSYTFAYTAKRSDSSIDLLGADIQKAAATNPILTNNRIYFANHGNGNLNYVYNRNAGAIEFGQSVTGAGTEKITIGYQNVGVFKPNSFWTFTFNGTLQAWIAYPRGLVTGVPFELQVELANEIGAGLWETIPAMYTNASVASMAKYAAEHLRPYPGLWVEYSNEIWNFAQAQTEWSNSMGAALGFPTDNMRQIQGWYALRFSQIMSIVKAAWGEHPGLHRVLAGWAFGGPADKYRLQGADLTSSGNPTYAKLVGVDYNAAPHRPIDYADGLSYAIYYEGAIITAFDYGPGNYGADDVAALKNAADNYQAGTPSSVAAAFTWVDNDIRTGTRRGKLGEETLSNLKQYLFPLWNASAAKYGLPLWNYEGGYQGIAPTIQQCNDIGISPAAVYCGPSGTIATMLAAYKHSPSFKQLVIDQFDQFLAAAPADSMPAWYSFSGNNQWAVFPTDIYSTPFQSYNAIESFK